MNPVPALPENDPVFTLAEELSKANLARIVAYGGLDNLQGLQIITGTAALSIISIVPKGVSLDDREKIYKLSCETLAAGLYAALNSQASHDTNRN